MRMRILQSLQSDTFASLSLYMYDSYYQIWYAVVVRSINF